MKTLSLITTAFFLMFSAVVSEAAPVQRISDETGVSVDTLQAERTSTGLGWGELGNAHLLANALANNGSNLTFDDLVAMHQAGEGWGKIAHDNGLNFGRVVSDAHRSNQATLHAQNTQTVHGKSTSTHGKSTSIHGKSTSVHGKSGSVHGKNTTNIGRGRAGTMGHSSFGFSSRRGPQKSARGGGMGHGGHGGGHSGH